MDDHARFDAEVTRCLDWLRHFEEQVPLVDGGAKRFACSLMEARVRYSWFKASTAGLPSLCLSDIAFSATHRGLAFLERLAARFAAGGTDAHELQAQVLYVEQPRGALLCNWLADHGFSLCPAPGEERQSWYLRRARAPERRHWAMNVAGTIRPSARTVPMAPRSTRHAPAASAAI